MVDIQINNHIEALKDDRVEVRVAAAEALGSLRAESALPEMIRLLADCDLETREAIEKAFLVMGKPAFVALIEATRNRDSRTRIAASRAIRRFQDTGAVPALVDALQDEDPFVRQSLATALGMISDEDAVSSLMAAYDDDASYARKDIVAALVRIGNAPAIVALVRLSSEPDRQVGDAARAAILHLGEQAIPVLLEALRHRDPMVQCNAAARLAELPHVRNGVRLRPDDDSIVEIVSALISALKHDDLRVRNAAASALGTLRPSAAVPALMESFNARRCPGTAVALALLGVRDALPLFIERLQEPIRYTTIPRGPLSPEQYSRPTEWHIACAQGLRIFGDPAAVPAFVDLLDCSDGKVAELAEQGLGEIGGMEAISALVRILREPHRGKDRAARVLKGLGDAEFIAARTITNVQLTPEERVDLIESLRSVRHKRQLRFKFAKTNVLCRSILANGTELEQTAAREVMQWLDRGYLVRASEKDPGLDKSELLHSVEADNEIVDPATLLRANGASDPAATSTLKHRSLRERLFGGRDRKMR